MNHTISSDALQPEIRESTRYPPSFIDRLMDMVERLPIPYWLTYLLLFVLQSVIFHILIWLDGTLPAYSFNPVSLIFPLWLWGPLAMMTYLDAVTLKALSAFSPLLDIPAELMQRLKYEFTTMPARSVIVSGIVWSVVYFLFTYATFETAYVTVGYGPLATAVAIIAGLVSFFVGSAIYYHSVRQLRLLNQTVSMVKQFDLFQLDPVYAFSVVTSRTSIAWMILLSLTLLIVPIQVALVPMLLLLIVQVVLAVAAFTIPLRVVNRHLVAEKRRLLAEVDQRLKVILARLHHCLDENDLDGLSQLNSALTGLNAEREILAKIPTWPWRPGMLTGFLSIVVLPIMLFLVQVVLGRWLGK